MKIGVNAGHTWTGAGSGAIGLFSEGKWTRIIGAALTQYLILGQAEPINCTVHSASTQSEYLKQAVEIANKNNVDKFISIHFNAGGGEGAEVYTYDGKTDSTALKIIEALKNCGFKNRGIKNGNGLYVVNNTKAPAYLIEICFCDSAIDTEILKENGADKIGQLLATAILS